MARIDLLTVFRGYLRDARPELIRIRAGLRDIKNRIETSKSKSVPQGVDPEKWEEFIKEWEEFRREYSNFQF